ncbi:MAG: MATE family efflux transporter [Oscillospiraceae bacterium]|jgi:putative MATE family efflux protein|nr:MATE family efflux transporter [Oscillospiraceae bacterium]
MAREIINDLTTGNVTKKLIRFALPFMLSTLLQTAYAMVDMIIVGRVVGAPGLSAVGMSSQISWLATALCIGFSNGGQIIISQLIGAGKKDELNRTIGTVTTLVFIAAVLISVLGIVFRKPLLTVMSAPEESFDRAATYLLIVFAGMIFTFGYNLVSALFRGMGDSRHPLIFVAIAAVTNLILDYIFVAIFKWDVAGAAVATIAGQAVSFICSAVYLLRHREQFGFDFKAESFRIDPERFKTLVKLGIPFALNNAAVTISMLFVNKFINQYGVVASATFATGTKIEQIPWIVGAGVMMGCTTMIGQNMGAGKVDRMKKTVRVGVVLCAITAVVFIALFRLFPRQIYQLFMAKSSDNYEEVLDMAPLFLKALSFALPATCLMCPYHAFASGIGNATLVMITALLDGFVSRIVISLLLAKVFGLGLYGWFLGYGLAAYVNTIICMIYYYSGVWKKRKAVFESFSK